MQNSAYEALTILGFVCKLGFGGEGRGRKGLWRGKPLFASFKKQGKGFGGFRRASFVQF
jgi:hypothetical protein